MKKFIKPIMVAVQAKLEASVITPLSIGPVVDPRLYPQLSNPVIIPYVCTLSLLWPFTLETTKYRHCYAYESLCKPSLMSHKTF